MIIIIAIIWLLKNQRLKLECDQQSSVGKLFQWTLYIKYTQKNDACEERETGGKDIKKVRWRISKIL